MDVSSSIVPPEYVFDSAAPQRYAMDDILNRYWLCIQIQGGTVAVPTVASHYCVPLTRVNEWIVNYVPALFPPRCTPTLGPEVAVIDAVGIALLLPVVNRQLPVHEAEYQQTLLVSITSQMKYTQDRAYLKSVVANYP